MKFRVKYLILTIFLFILIVGVVYFFPRSVDRELSGILYRIGKPSNRLMKKYGIRELE